MPTSTFVLPLNSYGNVDACAGLPAGVVLLPTEEAEERCERASIPTAKALIAFERIRRGRSRPMFETRKAAPSNWADLLSAWEVSETGVAVVEAIRAADQLRLGEKKALRQASAKKAAETRRRRTLLSKTNYGKLLLHLLEAQDASDRAKTRPSNNKHYCEYLGDDSSRYAKANYRRSRRARENDYFEKETAIENAVGVALQMGIKFGWKADPVRDMWVVYFELHTGQVSFHLKERFSGPEYFGEWDGVAGISRKRIEEAITSSWRETTANSTTSEMSWTMGNRSNRRS